MIWIILRHHPQSGTQQPGTGACVAGHRFRRLRRDDLSAVHKAAVLLFSLGLGGGLACCLPVVPLQDLREQDYNVYDRFASIFYVMGAFMVVMVTLVYIYGTGRLSGRLAPALDFLPQFLRHDPADHAADAVYLPLQNKKHLISAAFGLGLLLYRQPQRALFGAVTLALCCIYMVRFPRFVQKVVLGLFGVAGAAFFCLVARSEWVAAASKTAAGSPSTSPAGGF